jgi:hypothetical protein
MSTTPKLQRAVCEICGICDGPFHPDFDGYACEECQANWTERVDDDQRHELDEPDAAFEARMEGRHF